MNFICKLRYLTAQLLTITVFALFCSVSIALAQNQTGQRLSFDFNHVSTLAEKLAKEPYKDDMKLTGKQWQDITYDEYRSIRFNGENSLWHGESDFELQFFHSGFLYKKLLQFNLIENGASSELKFNPKWFRYDAPRLKKLSGDGRGIVGFRVHYPLHGSQYKDEFVVFQGASYFRILGRNQLYGLSARGLAIDTVQQRGEEFPYFKEFWIEKPSASAPHLTVYALLDSPSVSGAYKFIITPGTITETEVTAHIYLRREVERFGVAPLTSMFYFGETRGRDFDDFRDEVHDSDGLLMHSGSGEWLWRPLGNRSFLSISSLADNNPRGFGLLQRDLNYDHYQDLDANYHRRPSVWVEPLGDWGKGIVNLIEISSRSETDDNIVAFWVPDNQPKIGEKFEISYKLSSFLETSSIHRGAKVVQTRIGSAKRPGYTYENDSGARLFVIDFEGEDLRYLNEDQPIEGIVSTSSGKIERVITHKNPSTGGWRLFFDFIPAQGQSTAEMRAFLKLRSNILSETWSYLWSDK